MNSIAIGYKRISNIKFSALVRGQVKRGNALDLKIVSLEKELDLLRAQKSKQVPKDEEINAAADDDDEGETPSLPHHPIETQWVDNKKGKERNNASVESSDPICIDSSGASCLECHEKGSKSCKFGLCKSCCVKRGLEDSSAKCPSHRTNHIPVNRIAL